LSLVVRELCQTIPIIEKKSCWAFGPSHFVKRHLPEQQAGGHFVLRALTNKKMTFMLLTNSRPPFCFCTSADQIGSSIISSSHPNCDKYRKYILYQFVFELFFISASAIAFFSHIEHITLQLQNFQQFIYRFSRANNFTALTFH
jgi:hypothetical protein